MSFRAPHSREKVPHCQTCGAGSPHWLGHEDGTGRWICASCEYREQFPDAPMIPTVPRERRPLPLQTERLFDVAG